MEPQQYQEPNKESDNNYQPVPLVEKTKKNKIMQIIGLIFAGIVIVFLVLVGITKLFFIDPVKNSADNVKNSIDSVMVSTDKVNKAKAQSIASGVVLEFHKCAANNQPLSTWIDSSKGGGLVCTGSSKTWPALPSGWIYGNFVGNTPNGSSFDITNETATITCTEAEGCDLKVFNLEQDTTDDDVSSAEEKHDVDAGNFISSTLSSSAIYLMENSSFVGLCSSRDIAFDLKNSSHLNRTIKCKDDGSSWVSYVELSNHKFLCADSTPGYHYIELESEPLGYSCQ